MIFLVVSLFLCTLCPHAAVTPTFRLRGPNNYLKLDFLKNRKFCSNEIQYLGLILASLLTIKHNAGSVMVKTRI